MKERVNCCSVPECDLPAPHSVKRNGWVFISGVTGDTERAADNPADDFERQAQIAMARLAEVAKQSGIGMDELLKCNVYLKDMSALPIFEKVYAAYFKKGVYPARYVFQMPSLLKANGLMVEAIGRKAPRQGEPFQPVLLSAPQDAHLASDAVKSGNFIFTSAIPPAVKGSRGASFDGQVRSAAETMIRAVELAGGSKKDIVKVVVFLRDLELFDRFNAVYREYFDKGNNPPARSCFGVSSFENGCEVSLECVAYTGDDRETLCSPDVPAYDLPFCQGIRAEDMVFISGQVGCDKKLGGMPEKFEDQMAAVLRNMLSVAREAGAGPGDFVRTTGYLVNAEDYDEYKRLYAAFWGGALPASITLHVSGISYEYAMEIDSHVCLSKHGTAGHGI